eukprot:m.326826 g.326826  ORF g.326826 m.326826 type:complete len:424 (-) comp16560_c2_seq75:188-1459(-)
MAQDNPPFWDGWWECDVRKKGDQVAAWSKYPGEDAYRLEKAYREGEDLVRLEKVIVLFVNMMEVDKKGQTMRAVRRTDTRLGGLFWGHLNNQSRSTTREVDLPAEYQMVNDHRLVAEWRWKVHDLESKLQIAQQEAHDARLALGGSSMKTFYDSNFKKAYNKVDKGESLKHQDQLFAALRKFIDAFVKSENKDQKDGEEFFKRLTKEAFAYQNEVLEEVVSATQRLWTSTITFPGTGRELCNLLNEAIRKDKVEVVEHVAVLAWGIAGLCVARNQALTTFFPPDSCAYRGAVLPDEHIGFFNVGRKYRVPGFLATSFEQEFAKRFCQRAWHANNEAHGAVIWIVDVDPAGKIDKSKLCQHAGLVLSSHFQYEKEYLFVPYSVFTVKDVKLSNNPNYRNPHIIRLEAAHDNKLELENLPLAPWY